MQDVLYFTTDLYKSNEKKDENTSGYAARHSNSECDAIVGGPLDRHTLI